MGVTSIKLIEMSIAVESTNLESTEASSPGSGGLKAETDLEVLVSRLAQSRQKLLYCLGRFQFT